MTEALRLIWEAIALSNTPEALELRAAKRAGRAQYWRRRARAMRLAGPPGLALAGTFGTLGGEPIVSGYDWDAHRDKGGETHHRVRVIGDLDAETALRALFGEHCSRVKAVDTDRANATLAHLWRRMEG